MVLEFFTCARKLRRELALLEYPRVIRDGKPSTALVYHCSDPDFLRVFKKFIEEQNLSKYDLLVRPAPEKTLAEDPSNIAEIKKLHSLHQFGRILLLAHVNCGGLGIKDEAEEIQVKFDYFEKDRELLASELSGVEFEPHVFGWDKEIIVPVLNPKM